MKLMPKTLMKLSSVKTFILELVFGEKNDKVLDNLNLFVFHVENFRIGLTEQFGPMLVLNFLFLPIYIIVMLANCIKEAVLWWINALVLVSFIMSNIGGLISVMYAFYRAYDIYTDIYDERGNRREDTEAAPDDIYDKNDPDANHIYNRNRKTQFQISQNIFEKEGKSSPKSRSKSVAAKVKKSRI